MTQRRIRELLDREGPKIRKRFRQVMQRVKDRQTIAELETALAEGRIAEVLDDIEAAAEVIATRVEAVHLAVAHEVADVLSASLDKLVSYNATNPRAVEVLQRNRLRLVQGITDQQREVILDVIADGIANGTNPREQARAIRDTLGLTRAQAKAVLAYRARLETPDPAPEPSADGAAAPPKGRDPAQVDRMVERFTNRQLQIRAEALARTEAKAAVHEGMEQGYQQAVDAGTLPADQLEMKWHAGTPPRTRLWHAVMNGQTRPWGERFVSGKGNALRFPGDPEAPPEERQRCRCAKSVRVLAAGKTPTARDGAIKKGNAMVTMIAGWSGTGKTTLAQAMAAEQGVSLLSTDDFIKLGWSGASAHVAELCADGAPRIVEGVAVPRVLRKLLAAAPTVRPCDRLIVLTHAHREQTPGQVAQGKGHDSVLAEVMPTLLALGVAVEYR